MAEPAARLKRTLFFGLLVVLAAGLARTLAMQGVAAVIGADVSSADPLVRRDGLLLGWGILAGVLVGGAVLAFAARPDPVSVLALRRPVLFGVARQQSGSSLTTVAPHVLGNLKVLVLLGT